VKGDTNMDVLLAIVLETVISIATTVVYVVGVVEIAVRISPTLRKVLKVK
jgi:sporulation-control protein spo0M